MMNNVKKKFNYTKRPSHEQLKDWLQTHGTIKGGVDAVAFLYPSSTPPALGDGLTHNMVIAQVTPDGAATSVTITHNMVVSAADLALGLPNVNFEPQDANFALVAPFVSSKTADTVVITHLAHAGVFNVVIKRPNTIDR